MSEGKQALPPMADSTAEMDERTLDNVIEAKQGNGAVVNGECLQPTVAEHALVEAVESLKVKESHERVLEEEKPNDAESAEDDQKQGSETSGLRKDEFIEEGDKNGAGGEMNANAPVFQQKHVLMFSWSFYYDHPGKRVSQQNWSSFIKKLNTFHTVEDFWCLYNNIVPPSRLAPGSNFHLFKEGIEPKWEDPCNERGGKWILAMPRTYREVRLDDFWLRTVLSMIGENFLNSEEVCGCVISLRKSQDKIAIWTTDAENTDAILSIGHQMREFLEVPEDLSLGYQVHTDSIKRNSSYNNRNRYEL